MLSQSKLFSNFARWSARATGHTGAFVLAVLIIIAWLVTGPLFGFSDTWQLVINTGTTVITFLMVFLMQNTQTRDTEAMHLKLDELIRAIKGAQNSFIDLEELTEEELNHIKAHYLEIAQTARQSLKKKQPN